MWSPRLLSGCGHRNLSPTQFDFSAVPSHSMKKFEGGYIVETVFDCNKLGIEPYSVDVSPRGELLVLDSENSNIYKISTLLSRSNLQSSVKEGKISEKDLENTISTLKGVFDYESFKDMDMVIVFLLLVHLTI